MVFSLIISPLKHEDHATPVCSTIGIIVVGCSSRSGRDKDMSFFRITLPVVLGGRTLGAIVEQC